MTVQDRDLPAFLDKRPITWSYSMLNCYRDVCAHQMFRRYIVKDIPYVESPQMARGNAVHSALEARIVGGKQLPADMHTYEQFARAFDGKGAKCEAKLAITKAGKPCDYFAKDVWGRGRADVFIVSDDKAYLCDFKTGNVREDPFELEVQAVLLHAKYPQLKVIKGQYAWLKEMTLGPLHDLSDTQATWDNICHLMSLIEHDRKRGIFDKEPGPLCGGKWGSCPVADCEHRKGAG